MSDIRIVGNRGEILGIKLFGSIINSIVMIVRNIQFYNLIIKENKF